MSTELHLTIRAETALLALNELAELGVHALQELGGAPQPANINEPELPLPTPAAAAKGDGADPSTKGDGAAAGEKRTRKRAAPEAPAPDRAEIVKGLTELYMGGDPTVRERITAFRDGYGAQRLRELKDEALPEAMKLLAELQQVAGP
jgi:hypothetical protein